MKAKNDSEYKAWLKDYHKRIQKMDKELAETFRKCMAERIFPDEPKNKDIVNA